MQGSWLRIVCSQRSLQFLIGEVDVLFDDGAEVLLDRELVLRGGGDDRRAQDRAVVVDLVAVVQKPARRLGGAVAYAATRLHLDRGAVRLLVAVDDGERLVTSLHELDAADHDALERVAAIGPQAGLARGFARRRPERARG